MYHGKGSRRGGVGRSSSYSYAFILFVVVNFLSEDLEKRDVNIGSDPRDTALLVITI